MKYVDGVTLIEQSISKQAGNTLLPSGLVVLTNLRVISITAPISEVLTRSSSTVKNSGDHVGWGFDLCHVAKVDDCNSSFVGRSKRLHFELCSNHDGGSTHQNCLGLKFPDNSGEKESFLAATRQFLAKKSWNTLRLLKVGKSPDDDSSFSTNTAGVAGILRRQEDNLRAADELTREALGDLDSLMNRAREVATMVQRYATYAADREKKEGGTSTSSGETESDILAEVDEMDEILQSIGIASPVTKFSAGRLYHQQLARQLADFLLERQRLKRMGGMVTLTDVYGIFNRARGTELVSPDDFLCSVELIGALGLGITTKSFPSGVHMLQLSEMNEQTINQELHTLSTSTPLRIDEGLRVSEVAQHYRISLVVAREMLLAAEMNGILCRDDDVGGLAFFPNKFLD